MIKNKYSFIYSLMIKINKIHNSKLKIDIMKKDKELKLKNFN